MCARGGKRLFQNARGQSFWTSPRSFLDRALLREIYRLRLAELLFASRSGEAGGGAAIRGARQKTGRGDLVRFYVCLWRAHRRRGAHFTAREWSTIYIRVVFCEALRDALLEYVRTFRSFPKIRTLETSRRFRQKSYIAALSPGGRSARDRGAQHGRGRGAAQSGVGMWAL